MLCVLDIDLPHNYLTITQVNVTFRMHKISKESLEYMKQTITNTIRMHRTKMLYQYMTCKRVRTYVNVSFKDSFISHPMSMD